MASKAARVASRAGACDVTLATVLRVHLRQRHAVGELVVKGGGKTYRWPVDVQAAHAAHFAGTVEKVAAIAVMLPESGSGT